MISSENVQQLTQNNINYIVGQGLEYPHCTAWNYWQKHHREDGKSIRIKVDNGYLICSYSSARYRKDKYEMESKSKKQNR